LFPKLRFQEFDGAWSNSKIDDIAVVTSGGTPSRSNLTFWDGNNVKLSLSYETYDKEIDHSKTAKNSLG
jgi:type I restriction enzyme S subunit